MASWYDRHIVPRFVSCACGAPAIMAMRTKIVPQAYGEVLELGLGSGLNLAFYDPARVQRITAVEPSSALREKALAAPRPIGIELNLRAGVAEALPFSDNRFDCVVCTFTLCSVTSPARVLSEVKRVLRPGGRLLFCEHGLAPDAAVAWCQRLIEPIWTPLAGGCHLTRSVSGMLTGAGLETVQIGRRYLPGVPKMVGWLEWGEAVVPSFLDNVGQKAFRRPPSPLGDMLDGALLGTAP